MKIAVFHNLAYGGALRVVFEHVRYLAKRCSIDLYTYEFNRNNIYDLNSYRGSAFRFEEYCKHVFRFSPPIINWPQLLFSRYTNPYLKAIDLIKIDRFSIKMANQINSRDYDVVITYPDRITQAPLFLRYLEIPSIYYLQEPNRYIYDLYQHYQMLKNTNNVLLKVERLLKLIALYPYRRPLQYFDYVNTVSAYLHLTNSRFSKQLVDQSYRVNSIVCYLGVDTENFCPLDKHIENQVVVVSNLAPHKAQDFVIQSLALIPISRRPRLVLCYKAANRFFSEKLRHLGQREKVDIEFVEGASDKEVAEIYNRSKLAIYVPIREPFGLVPLEAMACSTPVIGINEGGVRETIINEYTGFLVNRNLEELAKAIDTLIDNEQLRNRLGDNGRRYVLSNWTWDKSGATLEKQISLL